MPQVNLVSSCLKTSLFFGNELKGYLFYGLDLENDEIFFSLNLDLGHLKSNQLRKLYHTIVEFTLNQIQNFEAVQNSCSNNHLQQPGRTFLAFFLFFCLFVSDPLITEINEGLHVRLLGT